MDIHIKYMMRCLQLAENGRGYVSPNPMVGSVIVCDGRIIGEGFHQKYGEAHAEVNAVNSVKDKSLLTKSVIYVSLEPCSHYGKTPPCAQLIIDSKIPEVVVAVLDPNPLVAGRGVKMLQDAGVKVTVGVCENAAKELNKAFFTSQLLHRPYIYLKWAQTADGFIDKIRDKEGIKQPSIISNDFTKMLVHKRRAEIAAIMVGTNTVLYDNPSLTTREWYGKNPIRIILDRQGRILQNYSVFDAVADTVVFTELVIEETISDRIRFLPLKFNEDALSKILIKLNELKIDSVLVEGGRYLLESFIKEGIWDEAFIEIADKKFEEGVKAPQIEGDVLDETFVYGSRILHLKNKR